MEQRPRWDAPKTTETRETRRKHGDFQSRPSPCFLPVSVVSDPQQAPQRAIGAILAVDRVMEHTLSRKDAKTPRSPAPLRLCGFARAFRLLPASAWNCKAGTPVSDRSPVREGHEVPPSASAKTNENGRVRVLPSTSVNEIVQFSIRFCAQSQPGPGPTPGHDIGRAIGAWPRSCRRWRPCRPPAPSARGCRAGARP